VDVTNSRVIPTIMVKAAQTRIVRPDILTLEGRNASVITAGVVAAVASPVGAHDAMTPGGSLPRGPIRCLRRGGSYFFVPVHSATSVSSDDASAGVFAFLFTSRALFAVATAPLVSPLFACQRALRFRFA